MPSDQTPGRSLVTRRAIVDSSAPRRSDRTGSPASPAGPSPGSSPASASASPASRVRLDDGLEIELDLDVALGVPVAEVARQVDSAVRYAVRRALGREVGRLVDPRRRAARPAGGAPPAVVHGGSRPAIRPRDLADSGTDVA